MRPQTIGALALLGSVSLAAANDVVSLMLPMVDQQDLVAKVIGSDGPMTTYLIGCPEGADSNDCGVGSSMTVTAGHSTYIYEISFDDYSLRESCKYRSTTWVSCDVTNTQSDFSSVMAITTSIDVPYVAVTVTSTETDAVTATSTATDAVTVTSTAISTSAASAKSASGSESESSSSITAQPSGSASPTTDSGVDAEETSSDNAAMAQVTGSATQWLVSGAGMALALALA